MATDAVYVLHGSNAWLAYRGTGSDGTSEMQLDAVWLQVFDDAKVVEHRQEDGAAGQGAVHDGPRGATPSERMADRVQDPIGTPSPLEGMPDQEGAAAQPPSGRIAHEAVAMSFLDHSPPLAKNGQGSSAKVQPSLTRDVQGQRLRQLSEPDEADRSLPRTTLSPPPDDEAKTAESVHVYETDEGLDVVVRNVSLEGHAAIGSALDTAYWLTGTRSALRKLTLNGSTVYEAASEPSASPTAAITFRC
jgi:hypothetical protein